jgi:hypothetical protein
MKRYLITSPRFTGEAELIYSNGVLKKIDCTATDMQASIIHHFKSAVPAFEDNIAHAFQAPTIVVASEIEIHFNEFWIKYDLKFNKDRCEKLWNRLSKSEKVTAFFELDKYLHFLRKNPTRFKMHPDTYLRNKAWENDYN